MESEDSYIFCHSDLLSNYLPTFEDMKQKGQFCDVTIRVSNRSFSAHRIILAAGIPYFREVFTNDKEISLTEICPNALESLIEFAYCGRIKITFENVRALFSASMFLQQGEVEDACCKFLMGRLGRKNALSIRILVEGLNCANLIESSNQCFQENFGELSETEEFLSLPFSCIRKVVEKDYLNVANEEKVFEAIIKWIKVTAERHDMLPELLRHVRLAHLNHRYLIEQVATEELLRTSIPCRDLIDEAKNYHLLPGQSSLACTFKTQPRYLKNVDLMYIILDSVSYGCNVKYYNASSQEWVTSASGQNKNVKHVVSLNDEIYIFGNKFEVFNLKTCEWTCLSSEQMLSIGASVVLHRGKIYVFGAAFDEQMSSVVQCYDPEHGKWSSESATNTLRSFSGIVSSEDYIYIVGGQYDCTISKSVERYNPQNKEWNKLSPMLTKRYRHHCAARNGKIYACGGFYDYFSVSVTAEVYDTCLNQWCFITPMRNVDRVFSLLSWNQKLYAFCESVSEPPFKITYHLDIFDAELNEWKLGEQIPGEITFSAFAGAVIVAAELDKK